MIVKMAWTADQKSLEPFLLAYSEGTRYRLPSISKLRDAVSKNEVIKPIYEEKYPEYRMEFDWYEVVKAFLNEEFMPLADLRVEPEYKWGVEYPKLKILVDGRKSS